MRNILYSIYLLFCFVGWGCSHSDHSKSDAVFELFSKGVNKVVLIPSEGCTGCIFEITTYLLNNPPEHADSIGFVFTNIKDRKGISILLSPIIDLPMIKIDFNGRYYESNHDLSNFPVVIEKEHRKMKVRKYEMKDTIFFK